MRFESVLKGRDILVTGHSGFTGGWLSLWAHALGCKITGLALPPATQPSLFDSARIADVLDSELGDIRDFSVVQRTMQRARPEVVFHLAAQPLISHSFVNPIETIATNVMGTAHVLEAARHTPSVKAVVVITTDKVYADLDEPKGHCETDQLGGHDAYSTSKASAELIAACYRASLTERANGCLVATARGGNIIGGGDWSQDRIIPDFVRAVVSGSPLILRRPQAVRPWQHVLALVHGYLMLAARLLDGHTKYADAWNFGPTENDAVPVCVLVEHLSVVWSSPAVQIAEASFPERHFLRLDSTKARNLLDWAPPLNFADTVALTGEWYRDYYARPSSARELTAAQIDWYRQKLRGFQHKTASST